VVVEEESDGFGRNYRVVEETDELWWRKFYRMEPHHVAAHFDFCYSG
jgi:hypothetical protein